MLSKELVSEVYGFGNSIESICRIMNTVRVYFKEIDSYVEYNENEVMSDCKKWAASKGIYIYSGFEKNRATAWYSESGSGFENVYFYTTTEPDVVFKACEHLRKELND